MTNNIRHHLHPVEHAHVLESKLRRYFQDPAKMISKYVEPGMNVLDLGCGTGYFTIEIAKYLNNTGKVVAADVQRGMLEILAGKIRNCAYGQLIKIFHCDEHYLGLNEKFDFILCFYSFHEIKFLDNIVNELTQISHPKTKILIAEQKYHVPKAMFMSFVDKMQGKGFRVIERPGIFLSRAVLMQYGQNGGEPLLHLSDEKV